MSPRDKRAGGGRRRGPRTNGHAQVSDEKLVGLVAGRDLGALGELYDRFGSVAHGLALAVLHDRSLAEDVLEEAFLDVWRSGRRSPAQAGSVQAWLLVLVHRRAISRARDANYSRNGRPQEVTPGRISSLLDRLPREEREAIVRSYFGGRTCSELAAAANVTPKIIGQRMLSGLRHLSQPRLSPSPLEDDAF